MTKLDPVLVVVPAFNEEASVGEVVREVRAAGFDVCVIDDGSSDATADVAAAAGATVVRLPINLGVGGALRCGFRYAVRWGYAVVVQIDADHQHLPDEIPVLLDRMRATGADMVIGTRFDKGSPAFDVGATRRLAMRLLAWRATRTLGTRITDATSGLRAIRRPLLEEFARNYPVEYLGDTLESMVIAGRRGARVVECPVRMSARAAGRPSAGPLASFWYVLRVLLAIELTEVRLRRPPDVAFFALVTAVLAAVITVLAIQAVHVDDLLDTTEPLTAGFAKALVVGYWLAVAAIVGTAAVLPAKRLGLLLCAVAVVGAVPLVATLLVGRELWSAATAVLTLCACWTVGRWTLAWLRAPVLAELVPAAWLAGAGVLGLAILFVGRAGLLRWWTVGVAVLVLGTFGTVSLGRMLLKERAQIWQRATGSRLAVACASLAVMELGLASVWTAAPELMYDALYAKAWLPEEWSRIGAIEPLTRHPVLNIAGFAQVLAVPGHLLDAPGVGRYLQWLTVGVLPAAVWWGARRSAWAPLGAVTVALTPHLFWQATTAYDDTVLALAALSLALAVARVLTLARPLTAAEAAGIGVLAGACVDFKLHLAPLAAGLALGVLLASRRPGTLAGLAAGGLAVALPPFLMRWIDVGNPVLPALNNVFRSEYWRPVNESLNLPFLHDPGPLGPLSTLGRALVDTGALGEAAPVGAFGVFAPAVVAALLVLLWLPRSPARVAVWLGLLLAAVSWYLQLRYLRYLVPAGVIAVTALAAAGPLAALSRREERVALAAVALTAVLLWPSTVAQFWNVPGRDLPWRAALRLEPDRKYERSSTPERSAVAAFDRLAPPGALAVSLAHQRLWLTDGRDLMPQWELTILLQARGEPPPSTPEEALRRVRAVGVGWILAEPDGLDYDYLETLAARHGQVVWRGGGWTLYRLVERPEEGAAQAPKSSQEREKGAFIKATPAPVPVGGKTGTTTISWSTGSEASSGEVYVVLDGGSEKLFAREGPEGSAEAPWIFEGGTYVFRLYAGTEQATLLDQVKVTTSEQARESTTN